MPCLGISGRLGVLSAVHVSDLGVVPRIHDPVPGPNFPNGLLILIPADDSSCQANIIILHNEVFWNQLQKS